MITDILIFGVKERRVRREDDGANASILRLHIIFQVQLK